MSCHVTALGECHHFLRIIIKTTIIARATPKQHNNNNNNKIHQPKLPPTTTELPHFVPFFYKWQKQHRQHCKSLCVRLVVPYILPCQCYTPTIVIFWPINSNHNNHKQLVADHVSQPFIDRTTGSSGVTSLGLWMNSARKYCILLSCKTLEAFDVGSDDQESA